VLTTGVDLVSIPRLERAVVQHGERFLVRIYTPAELLWCRGRVPELAARFAAKEAVAKALGVGMRLLNPSGIYFPDVEVMADRQGKPYVVLHGRAQERASELKLTEWAISLSHEREMAIALVVAQ
jgi:holo-[acyl-carrier protein] synthase